jgi:very-short-patch-repair endonuclease
VASEASRVRVVPIGFHHRPAKGRARDYARNMRRDATDAEAAMWHLLRDRRFSSVKFRRQVPFQDYILDFVCFDRKLVIEIDGSQHLDSKRDEERDAVLASEGFQVIRYWNNDVLQRRDAVLEDLFAKLGLHQR